MKLLIPHAVERGDTSMLSTYRTHTVIPPPYGVLISLLTSVLTV